MNITGTAQNDILTGTDEDDLIRGLAGADRLLGRGGNDDLLGGLGDDLLDGNRGADRMRGEDGHDQYYVNDLGDTVLESTAGRAGGVDRVFASVNFILGDHLEHLTMYGAAVLGRGNDLANIIRGNSADNVLQGLRGDDVIFGGEGNDRVDGGLGADILVGGLGDDAYYADSRLDVVIEDADGGIDTLFTSDSRRLDANIENLTMYGRARNAVGNDLDNMMVGNSAANVILGEAGNDTISGGLGDDNLRGGDGDDVISGGLVAYDYVDWEDLYDEDGNVTVTYEDDGTDVIDGGTGTDTVVYADINYSTSPYDSLAFSEAVTVDLENGTAVFDNADFSGDILISIENVRTGASDDTVYGDDQANGIDVGEGFNVVFAGGGNDIVRGGGGFTNRNFESSDNIYDRYVEVLRGEEGDDTIYSGGSSVMETGFRYADYFPTRDLLIGGAGDDRLVAGGAFVTMVGGDGTDTFEFSDSTLTNDLYYGGSVYGSTSHITDYDPSSGDRIIITRPRDAAAPVEMEFGEMNEVGAGALGYERVVRGENTHTIVKHGFTPEFGFEDVIHTTIILDNYAGPISESDFLFV